MPTLTELRTQARQYGLPYSRRKKIDLVREIAEARAPEFTKRLQRAIETGLGPDSAHVLKSLIKTKHMAVVITGTDPFPVCPDPKRQKIAFYDLRAPNINSLRYNVATHDWSMCLQAADIQYVQIQNDRKSHSTIYVHPILIV